MQHSCSHYNAFCSITWLTRMYLRTWQQSMTTIMQPFQCDLQPQIQKRIELRRQEQPLVAEHRGGTNSRMKRPPAAHRRYLSPPAAATSRGKAQVFVLRLPPQHEPHATFMQPPHCILQHDVANPHVSTHMATPDDSNPTAITRVHCYVMSSLTPQPHATLH